MRRATERSPERISEMVDAVIAERLAEGQLDDCDLTLKDIRTIAESFKATMRDVYHPRVQYPAPTAAEERRRMLRFPQIRQLPMQGPAAPPTPEAAEPRGVGQRPVLHRGIKVRL